MQAIYAFVVGGGVLALIGWAAWTLSGGFTVARPGLDTPYRHGLDALLRGDRDEALLAFTETVQIDTDNVDAYIHLGNLLRERGEAARALRIHRELTVRAGQTPAQQRAVREGLILDLIALERPEEAVEEAEDLHELDPKHIRALRILLRAYEAAGDWEHAFEARSELARLNGEHVHGELANYRSAIGEGYLRTGRVREAEKHLRGALRNERNHPAALLRLGDIYYDRGRPERAVVLWKGLAQTHPERANLVLERLETAYFEGGRFSEMAQAYEEMLARNPRDARVMVALARMHIKKGDLLEASRALADALAIEPESLSARLLLVSVHRRRGDLSGALDEMEALLKRFERTERFTCAACGAASDEYWTRCPTCSAWSTVA